MTLRRIHIGLVTIEEVDGDTAMVNLSHQEYGGATFAVSTLERALTALLHKPRPEEAAIDLAELRTLLEVCRMCDLQYGAHDRYYGIGKKAFGVTITGETSVADIVDALISRLPQKRSSE